MYKKISKKIEENFTSEVKKIQKSLKKKIINEDNLNKALYYSKIKDIKLTDLTLLVLSVGNFFGDYEFYFN
jgi:hypothetical protein